MLMLVATLVVGCGPSEEERRAEMGRLCSESSELTTSLAGGGNGEAMMTSIQSTVAACGRACDLDDAVSCAELDRTMDALCAGMPMICDNLSELPNDDSVRRAARAARAREAGAAGNAP